MSDKLTVKQIRFCQEYIVDLNGTQAAIRAGYSENSAQQIASELLSKPVIQEYVQDLLDQRAARTKATADFAISEIYHLISFDPNEVFNEDGTLKLIKDIVYLYGYRPSDTKMVKIYKTVISNALIAYGLSTGTTSLGKTFGSGIVSMIDKASNSMNPLTSTFGSVVGGIAGTALESSLQFIVNSTFTTLIGYQTKKYLSKEYNLQDILDNVELVETPDEQVKMIESIKDEVRENLVKKHKKEKIKPAT